MGLCTWQMPKIKSKCKYQQKTMIPAYRTECRKTTSKWTCTSKYLQNQKFCCDFKCGECNLPQFQTLTTEKQSVDSFNQVIQFATPHIGEEVYIWSNKRVKRVKKDK